MISGPRRNDGFVSRRGDGLSKELWRTHSVELNTLFHLRWWFDPAPHYPDGRSGTNRPKWHHRCAHRSVSAPIIYTKVADTARQPQTSYPSVVYPHRYREPVIEDWATPAGNRTHHERNKFDTGDAVQKMIST